MGVIPDVKAIIDLAKKGYSVELQEQLVGLRE